MSEFRTINGVQKTVVDLPFEIVSEPWLEYSLADGGRARVRCVVTGILQVLDDEGRPARNPESGQLWIIVETNTTIGRLVT